MTSDDAIENTEFKTDIDFQKYEILSNKQFLSSKEAKELTILSKYIEILHEIKKRSLKGKTSVGVYKRSIFKQNLDKLKGLGFNIQTILDKYELEVKGYKIKW